MQRALVLAGHTDVHGHGLAIRVRPAAAVRILRIEVWVARQVHAPAVAEQLAKLHALEPLGGDVGLKDLAPV